MSKLQNGGWFVFNQTLDYKLIESNKDGLHAIFSDSKLEYEVHIKDDSVDQHFLTVSIIAGANGLEKNDELTGFGKPIPVLSTTVKILLEHLNIYGNRPVRLLAVDEPRCKLYYNISRKIFSDWYVCVAGNNVIVLPSSYFENKREINEENHCT